MAAADHDIEALKAVIIKAFPEHDGGQFTPITIGWDSIAIDVDGAVIFKFPRHDSARAALRREAAMLTIIRPALMTAEVPITVPDLRIVSADPMFSRHDKLPGDHLTAADYAKLSPASRNRLADDLARFYHLIHRLPATALKAVGATTIPPWLDADTLYTVAIPRLPRAFQAHARASLQQWQALPPDPHGMTYGYFDGHGWNMAFDHKLQTLNGLYDFADSGFGPLHQDFIASNLISADLTTRLVSAYQHQTGRRLELDRIMLLTTILRLSELAEVTQSPDSPPEFVAQVEDLTIDWLTSTAR